jgi:hypothetical protein
MRLSKVDESLYWGVFVALVVGIIFALGFNLFMRERIAADDAFSELYFTDHRNLPYVVEVGGVYSVGFAFANYEGENITYTWEAGDFASSFVVEDGGRLEVDFNWTVSGDDVVLAVSSRHLSDDLFGALEVEPLVFSLDVFGDSLNVNLSSSPLSFFSEDYRVIEQGVDTVSGVELALNRTTYSFENITFHVSDGRVHVESIRYSETIQNLRQPFIVKLYRGEAKDDPLQIHFWHLIK